MAINATMNFVQEKNFGRRALSKVAALLTLSMLPTLLLFARELPNYPAHFPATIIDTPGAPKTGKEVNPKNIDAIKILPISTAPTAVQKSDFYIDGVTIYAKNDRAGADAKQLLLREAGYNWYNFTGGYTYTPKAVPSLKQAFTARIQNREFAGTGGWGSFTQSASDFWTYRQKAGWTYDFADPGHMFDGFQSKFAKEIAADPGIMCAPYRLNLDNPKTLELIKVWVREIMQKNPANIGAGPADGAGMDNDCAPKNIRELNGIPAAQARGEKAWWVANEIAKQIEKEFPNSKTVVDMYAYGDGPYNARPPHFKLNKRMYIRIIPYAFQTAFATPKEMYDAWKKKADKEGFTVGGIYDYWNITQWSEGLIHRVPIERVENWINWGLSSVNIESTTSFWTAMWLWIANQRMSYSQKTIPELYTEYIQNNYGKDSAVVRKLFDFWQQNGLTNRAHLPYSLQLISKTNNETLKAYGHWATLKFNYRDEPTPANYNNLINYTIRTRNLHLVQAWAVAYYYTSPPSGYKIPEAVNDQTAPKLHADSFRMALNRDFAADVKANPVMYKTSSFVFDYSRAKALEPLKPDVWNFGIFPTFTTTATKDFTVYVGGESKAKWRILKDDMPVLNGDVDKENSDTVFKNNRSWNLKKLKLKPGKYTFSAIYGFNKLFSRDSILFYREGNQDFDNYAFPVFYFYMPKDVDEVVFSDPEAEGQNGRGYIIAEDGTQFKRQEISKNLYRTKIPEKYRGQVLTADWGHPGFQFYNIPNVMTLQKFRYE